MRDTHLRRIRTQGRYEWRKSSGCTRQSVAENAVSRYKAILGVSLSARTVKNQKVEAALDRSRKSVGFMLSIALCGRTVLSLVPRVLRFPLGQVTRPILHQDTPPLEQVRAGVGRLDLVPDYMRQGRLDHLSWMIRLLGRPVPETGAETV